MIESVEKVIIDGDENKFCFRMIKDGNKYLVPNAPGNTDYQEIMRQVEAGTLTIADAE
jgi:hypothetical protein